MNSMMVLNKMGMVVMIVLMARAFSFSQSYCASSGSNNGGEYISRVVFGTIDKSSVYSPYSDFTSIVGNVVLGNTYTLTLTIVANSSWTESKNAWIDFNNDGDFNDAGEAILLGTTQGGGDFTNSILISGTIGIHRMRVSLKYGASAPTSCEIFGDGEVEDYSINITGGCSDVTPPSNVILSTSTITSVINSPLKISSTAVDNILVTKVEFYADGLKLGESTISPYSLIWSPLTNGAKSITSRAYDACGNFTNSSPISINVTNYCSN